MPDGQSVSADLASDFKAAMRRLAATVTIITAGDEGVRHGMTATAVTSLTVSPPSLVVCINRSASIHDPAIRSGRFCVNVLACGHDHLVPVFGGRLEGEERFSTGDWLADAHGTPHLKDAQASLFCEVAGTMPHGSHTILIGNVERIVFSAAAAPLLYQDGALFRSVPLAG
jgi:flavin reductase (DIM6/NTAB) family NADH-FMN oxidoreductase RutF